MPRRVPDHAQRVTAMGLEMIKVGRPTGVRARAGRGGRAERAGG